MTHLKPRQVAATPMGPQQALAAAAPGWPCHRALTQPGPFISQDLETGLVSASGRQGGLASRGRWEDSRNCGWGGRGPLSVGGGAGITSPGDKLLPD